MATSPRGSTLEDELDEDQLFHEVNGQIKTVQNGLQKGGLNSGAGKQS